MVSTGCISIACHEDIHDTNNKLVNYVRLDRWLEPDPESEKTERSSCALFSSSYAKEEDNKESRKKIKKKTLRRINRKKGKKRSCFEFDSVLSCLLACMVRVDVVER